MPNQVFNFSAGPSILPRPVLEQAQDELRSYKGIGMSVMEISHRSGHFEKILADAKEGIRELLSLPDNYHVLFLQGGATLQFSMVPMNFLPADGSADYIVTGAWGKKAVPEAAPTHPLRPQPTRPECVSRRDPLPLPGSS